MAPNPRNALDGTLLVNTALEVMLAFGTRYGPGRAGGRGEQHPGRQVRVGTGVAEDLDLLRGERAVAARPGPVAHDERVPLGAADQRLLPVPDHPHRPPGMPDQQRQVRLDRHVLLAAEAAAHVRGDHPDLALRHLQDAGDHGRVLDDLGGHAEREHAVLQPAHPGLGLEVGVLDVLAPVLALDHHVGGGQRRRDVAAPDLPAHQRVADLVHPRRARRRGPTRRRTRRAAPRSRPTTSSAASAAICWVTAATTATGSPRYRTRSVGQHRHAHLELGQAAAGHLHDAGCSARRRR